MEPAADPVSTMCLELRRLGADPDLIASASEATRAIWGGGQAYIRRVDREARDHAIAELLAKGVSPEGIARHVKVHPATVRRKRAGWL